MKNPKLGFCRVSLGLFCHEKILVNKCWLKVWNFWSKFENPSKNSRFYWEDKHPGGFSIWCLNTWYVAQINLNGYVLIPFEPYYHIIKIEEMTIFWKLTKMRIWPIFIHIFFMTLKMTKMLHFARLNNF